MNDTTFTIYTEYLNRTDFDRSAAAALTLADTFQSMMDARQETPDAPATHQREASAATQPLTVPEVAKFLRVRQTKVLSWIRAGKLRAFNVTQKAGGRPKYRINRADLDAFTQLPAISLPSQKGRPQGRHRRRIPEPEWSG